MELFINGGICKRQNSDNIKIEILSNSRLKLSIYNYLENEEKWEYVSFIIPNVTRASLENGILLKNISLKRAGKNKYYISSSEYGEQQTHIYALLRSTEGIDDDVFIPRSMKEKVEVYRRLRFLKYNNGNSYFSNLYLVKIKLNEGERIPVYFSYGERSILKAYHSFYRPRWDGKCHVSEKMKTLIFLDKSNFREYISLSQLCE